MSNAQKSRQGFLNNLLISNEFKLNETHIEVIGIFVLQIITI